MKAKSYSQSIRVGRGKTRLILHHDRHGFYDCIERSISFSHKDGKRLAEWILARIEQEGKNDYKTQAG